MPKSSPFPILLGELENQMIPFKYGGGPKIKLLSSLTMPPRVTLGLRGLVESSTPRTTLEKTASVGCLVLVQTTRQNFLDSQKIGGLVRDRGIKECQAFGYSKILITKINSKDQFNNAILNKSLKRLKIILQDFTSFKIFHILRSSNSEADVMANKGCFLAPGDLNINGNSPILSSIP